jgi:hypothetical protein
MSAVTTTRAATVFGRHYNALHGGAAITHGLSYMTTLWFVQWLWPDGSLVMQSAIAYCMEWTLFALKKALESTEARNIGWTGVGVDGVINMGGLLPYAGAILGFPPIAALLALIGWGLGRLGVSLAWMGTIFHTLEIAGAQPIPLSLAVLLVGLGGGMLLSAAPVQLWRAADKAR